MGRKVTESGLLLGPITVTPAAVRVPSMSTLGSIWMLAAQRFTQEKGFYIEMDGSQMEEEESEPVFSPQKMEGGDLDVLKNGKGDL